MAKIIMRTGTRRYELGEQRKSVMFHDGKGLLLIKAEFEPNNVSGRVSFVERFGGKDGENNYIPEVIIDNENPIAGHKYCGVTARAKIVF